MCQTTHPKQHGNVSRQSQTALATLKAMFTAWIKKQFSLIMTEQNFEKTQLKEKFNCFCLKQFGQRGTVLQVRNAVEQMK